MTILEAIAALGWIPAVYLTGRALSARAGVAATADRWALAPAIGLAVWTVPMLLAALFGFYRPWIFGLVGWLLSVVLARRIFWRKEFRTVHISSVDMLAVAVAVGFGLLSLWFTGESFLGGRDQGGYANHALSIARSGSVWVAFPFESFGEARFGPFHYLQNLSNLAFTPIRMEAQFPPVYTIWMAQMAAVFGRMGILGFNPVLATLSVLLIYRLGRRFMGGPATLVALVVFAFNPAQLWVARVTLSEVSAQHMMAAALLCLGLSWSGHRRSTVILGAVLLGACFWIRIDGMVLAPALAAVFAALVLWGRPATGERLSDLRLMGITGAVVLALFATGIGFYWVFTHQYFTALSPMSWQLAGLTVAVVLGAGLLFNRACSSLIRDGLSHRVVAGVLVGSLVALLCWAYWIRPSNEPFALLERSPERGRDFREDSVVNLVAYISEPAAWLALLGLVGAAWALLRRRLATAWILPLGIWGTFTALYLYKQSIYPDHPWAIRRFVPVIIPGCALLAGYGFQLVTGWSGIRRFRPWICAVTCLALLATLYARSSTFVFFKENRGTVRLIHSIDGMIEPGSLVFSDTGTLFFDPLYPGLGLRVVRVNLSDRRTPGLIETIIRENTAKGDPVYYLTQEPRDHLIQADRIRRIPFDYDFIAPTITPPPRELQNHAYHLNLYTSREAPYNPENGYGNVTVGHSPVEGIEDSGFYGPESNAAGPFRWTDGNARLEIPLREGYRPRSVALDIGDGPPDGSELVLLANGIEFYRKALILPAGRIEADLPSDLPGGVLRLEMYSGTFVPAELPGRGSDRRQLGLCLHGVTLSDQFASKGTFDLGTVAVAGVDEAGFHGPEVNELGPYRWTDGAARLDLPLPGGYRLERIELNILDLPPGGTEIELRLNGESVYRETHSQPPGTIRVPVVGLEPDPNPSVLRIELLSDTFIPAESGIGPDDRSLGLRVHGITVTDRH